MTHLLVYPTYTAQEARLRETFLALMWAFGYPGTAYTLPVSANIFVTIADTLLDLETSFFSPDAQLTTALLRTGARALPADVAAYHFYPAISQANMIHLEAANPGSLLYPDRSATLILGCTPGSLNDLAAETTLVLEGPGIKHLRRVRVGGIPDAVWAARERTAAYPVGWDIFVVDPKGSVVGLPRGIQIEVEKQERQVWPT
jgi:alpha-D-ribose 1-methylphosphonate 5-triphosphate synthase subunit PhnH